MNGQVSLPLRRTLAITILLALVSVVLSGIIQPLLDDYRRAKASVDRLEAAIQRSQTADRDVTRVQAELAALKKRQASAGGFLQGTNESIAAAQLQHRLKTSVESAKGEVRSTQNLPSRDDGNFRRITVRAQISLGMAGLQRAFYDLESSAPFLFLDNIIIRARSVPQDRNKAAQEPVIQDPVLEVSFDLSGYMRRPM
jgi:general secretion pathway protein M